MFLSSGGQFIVYINRVAGVMLTISLIMHCFAVCKAGYGLFEVRDNFPYGFGTSFPWLLCYTVWNILFAARIGLGTTLQDGLFWAMMAAYKYWDGARLPIELYFGFARPVQLGSYIALSEFIGTFVPYFHETTTLSEDYPMPVFSNPYVLFIAVLNMFWSFLVVYWAGHRLIYGLGFFQERFEAVHELAEKDKAERSEWKQSGTQLVDAEECEEEEDEDGDDENERSGCILS